MRRLTVFCSTVLMAGGVAVAGTDDGRWTFMVGPAARFGMRAEAEGSSQVQALGLHAVAAGHDAAAPGQPDSPAFRYASGAPHPSGYADRSFSDGFVFMDPGTADPNSIVPGLTWNWGYDNASQYDAPDNTLSFHRDATGKDVQNATAVAYGRDVTVTPLRDESVALHDEMSGAGLGAAVGYAVASRGPLALQYCAGLKALWGAHSRMHAAPYAEQDGASTTRVEDHYTYTDTHAYRDTYTYDTTGIVPPPAPYAGTYNGAGPVIPNAPSSQSREVLGSTRQTDVSRTTGGAGSEVWTAANQIEFDVESALYELWLGPRIGVDVGQRLQVYALPSLSLNYVDVEAKRAEVFQAAYADGSTAALQTWEQSQSKGEWLFGAGLALGLSVAVGGGWSLGLEAGYDWVSREVDITVGPNTVQVDASGYTLSAQAGRTF